MALSDSEKQRRYRQRHPGRQAEIWRKYRATRRGFITQLLHNAMNRAKKSKVAFSISREWVESRIEKGVCDLTRIPFDLEPGGRGNYSARPFVPSIDRLKPGGNYSEVNCRLICYAVNVALSDWGESVLLKIALAIVKQIPITTIKEITK
jgi:hypothetical protein